MKTALIVTDFQKDFCNGGSLAIKGGEKIMYPLYDNLINLSFDLKVASFDWHPDGHSSFETWPKHCVQNTVGSSIYTEFKRDLDVFKGMHPEQEEYSNYKARTKNGEELHVVLKNEGIKTIFICGLALDYCVRYSAIDFIEGDFITYVILDACRAVDSKSTSEALYELSKKGCLFAYSESVFGILQEIRK